ncbi:hypothetical protein [Mucilaginibacter polytrichastri]|uniref:DUF1440 domain-containing protein n=1 Tax=Mucilaginibacter polytrichastri TaxID=1302689 RepID=A0A1Q6A6T5_9SPHI|nr:hypothetical protein [Mucilaginibacter polytrichastri]OKS89696.1 hypothetical protein RG47T_5181 [Mucilaginibacter polytrichastri]
MEKNDYKEQPGKYTIIAWVGLLTGTLDAVAAILSAHKMPVVTVFKFIASGIFGKAAFAGGFEMVAAGIFFHYLIACSITAVLFVLYPMFISFLKSKYVVAVVFALIAWVITHLVIVPLSRIGWSHMDIGGTAISIGILIITIGLPIALIADRYFVSKK